MVGLGDLVGLGVAVCVGEVGATVGGRLGVIEGEGEGESDGSRMNVGDGLGVGLGVAVGWTKIGSVGGLLASPMSMPSPEPGAAGLPR